MSRPRAQTHVAKLTYSLKEAADALSCSTTTLGRAISYGLIQSNRIGSVIRLPTEEVERIARDGLPKLPAGYKRKTDKRKVKRR